jgi:hypothetical protein
MTYSSVVAGDGAGSIRGGVGALRAGTLDFGAGVGAGCKLSKFGIGRKDAKKSSTII